MRDDRKRRPRVRLRQLFERRPCARDEVGHALALGKRKLADARHPHRKRFRLAGPDLLRRQTFPSPHGHLAQRRNRHRGEPPAGAEQLTAASRTGQITRVERGERDVAQPRRLGRALRFPAGRQWNVEMTDEAPRLRQRHLAVAEQIDACPRHRAGLTAATTSSTASSASSTAAPCTSPVTAPRRRIMNAPSAVVSPIPMTSASTPDAPSTPIATTTAIAVATAGPAGPSSARNRAPCPDGAAANI